MTERHGGGQAADGIAKDWTMKRERMSPVYTTLWSDLLRVSRAADDGPELIEPLPSEETRVS